MRRYSLYFTVIVILSFISNLNAQVLFEPSNKPGISFDTYGRVGVDWSFENGGSIGRRLNLNNMGSIGGRMEEQDYVELATSYLIQPFNENDPTKIRVGTRLSIYSQSLSLFGNSSTSSAGGLTFALPEMYLEASNINGKDLSLWVGAKFNRSQNVDAADHWYFDDHAGQGFGIKYKNTSFSSMFVSSSDTSANHPPYFFLNIGPGEPSIALRQRTVHILEHEFDIDKKNSIKLMGELHRMTGNKLDDPEEPVPLQVDSSDIILNYPSDYGFVVGAKWFTTFGAEQSVNYNRLAVRYGTRLANGGDGGHSKTWGTFGAPDLEQLNFKGAYSLYIVDDFLVRLSEKNDLNVYMIFTKSKGAAASDNKAKTYWGREIYNRKTDFTIGSRDVFYVSEKFHFISELHYSQRKDGTEDTYSYAKVSLVPTFVPTGFKNFFSRPQFRFVCSIARYNDAAKDTMYSPYLEYVGSRQWGYYFGVKAEWWL